MALVASRCELTLQTPEFGDGLGYAYPEVKP